jgi:hypothetical protein
VTEKAVSEVEKEQQLFNSKYKLLHPDPERYEIHKPATPALTNPASKPTQEPAH